MRRLLPRPHLSHTSRTVLHFPHLWPCPYGFVALHRRASSHWTFWISPEKWCGEDFPQSARDTVLTSEARQLPNWDYPHLLRQTSCPHLPQFGLLNFWAEYLHLTCRSAGNELLMTSCWCCLRRKYVVYLPWSNASFTSESIPKWLFPNFEDICLLYLFPAKTVSVLFKQNTFPAHSRRGLFNQSTLAPTTPKIKILADPTREKALTFVFIHQIFPVYKRLREKDTHLPAAGRLENRHALQASLFFGWKGRAGLVWLIW